MRSRTTLDRSTSRVTWPPAVRSRSRTADRSCDVPVELRRFDEPGLARRSRARRPDGAEARRHLSRRAHREVNVCSSRAVSGNGPAGGAPVPSSAAAAGSSIRARGLPAPSSRIRRRRSAGSVSGARSSSAPAESSSSPARRSSGRSASSKELRSPSRTAKSRIAGSDSTRRAMNSSTCTEGRSSQCASSTTKSSGVSAARSATSPSAARPIKNRSGASPSAIPNAASSARRCGSGRRSSPPSRGSNSWCRPAKASVASERVPVVDTTVAPRCRARSRAAVSKADLPIPASPRTTSAAPCVPIPSISS
jgi:hypothetical protein